MPVKPLSPCSVRDCSGRATHQGWCIAHYQQARQAYEAHRPQYEKAVYSTSDWRRLRAVYLKRHPSCSVCGTQATEVHHIVSLDDDPTLRLEWSNLLSLCKPCHSRITTKQNGAGWQGNKSAKR